MTVKSICLTALLLMMLTISGCYLHIISPLDTDVSQTTLGSKTGESSCYSILWMVAWGDAGTAAAAENGEITVVNHMDRETFVVCWGLYAKETTIVYGD